LSKKRITRLHNVHYKDKTGSWLPWLADIDAVPISAHWSYKKCMELIGVLGALVGVPRVHYPGFTETHVLLVAISIKEIKDLLLMRQINTRDYGKSTTYELYAVDKAYLIPFVKGGIF